MWRLSASSFGVWPLLWKLWQVLCWQAHSWATLVCLYQITANSKPCCTIKEQFKNYIWTNADFCRPDLCRNQYALTLMQPGRSILNLIWAWILFVLEAQGWSWGIVKIDSVLMNLLGTTKTPVPASWLSTDRLHRPTWKAEQTSKIPCHRGWPHWLSDDRTANKNIRTGNIQEQFHYTKLTEKEVLDITNEYPLEQNSCRVDLPKLEKYHWIFSL